MQPPPTSSTGQRLHLALTALLLLAAAGALGLVAAGQVRVSWGEPEPAPANEEAPSPPEKKAPPKKGRYRVEYLAGASEAVTEAGEAGFLGGGIEKAWVFRYSGGYLQAQADFRMGEFLATIGPAPGNWQRTLAGQKGAGAERRGFVILAALQSRYPPSQVAQFYFPHLGGICASLTASPLQLLCALPVDAFRLREYRLLVVATPEGKGGTGLRLVIDDHVIVPGPLLGDYAELSAAERLGGGPDLGPGQDLILLERSWGGNRFALQARFLPDAEVERLRAAPPEK